MPHTGRCLCDAVRYAVTGDLGPLIHCHCRFCRRAHGAPFVTVTPVPRQRFRWTAGESLVREHANAAGSRLFCSACGSRLLSVPRSAPGILSLVVASLDDPPSGPALMHINVESKAPWHEIRDDLPQHAGLPQAAGRALEKGRV